MPTTHDPPPTSRSGDESADMDSTEGQRSSQRRIAGASGYLMVAVLISRILGLVRDRVISTHFGQGFETDIYNAAFTVPDLIFFLIAGGGLSSAIIPTFTDYVSQGREKEAWKIFKVLAVITTIVVSGLILLGEALAYSLVERTNPGWTPAQIAATVSLTRILLPAQLCFFLGGLMMGVLQTRHIMSGQAIGPIIYNLGIIFGGIVLTHFAPPGIRVMGLCWGAVLGAVLGNLCFQWYLVRRMGGRWERTGAFKLLREPGVKAGVKQVWYIMLPIIVGVALPQVSAIVNKYYASFLTKGAQSALMNANRLMQVPLGIFGQAIAIAILPTMAAQAVEKNMAGLRRTANFGLRFILFLTIPASVFMIVLSLPLVQLLLQGGKYHTEDSQRAALALTYYSLGIFAWSAQSIIGRAFISIKDSKTPAIVGTIVTLVVFLPINRPLMGLLGFGGLALATSIAASINMLVLLFLLRLRLHGIEGAKLLVGVAKIVTASAVSGVVCRLLRNLMQAHADVHAGTREVLLHAMETLIVCGSVGILVYIALALALRMEEIRPLRKLLLRK